MNRALPALLCLAFTAVPRTEAADLYVDTTGDDAGNPCNDQMTPCATIQRAIDVAAVDDVIHAEAGTYIENLTITAAVTVRGENGRAVVDGNGADAVITISGSGAVALVNLEVINGSSTDGAGINARGVELTVNDSVVRDNIASGNGGGLSLRTTTFLNRTMVQNNSAGGRGGGISADRSLTLDRTTVASNESLGPGGGIAATGGALSALNATIADNTAGDDGGGVYAVNALFALRNSTVARNRTDTAGGGLAIDGTASGSIANSILHGNRAPLGADCAGPLTSDTYNIIGDTSDCTLTGDLTGNQVGVNPLLGALNDNGGPTPTMMILAGSPAIDAGDPAGCDTTTGGALTRDQRGQARPADCGIGRLCDVGAVETSACNVIDAVPPREVGALKAVRAGADAVLTWDPVTVDHAGQPETVDSYRIYRDVARALVPDRGGRTNLAGAAQGPTWSDIDAADDGQSYFYLVTAVDAVGNEGRHGQPRVLTPPTLSGTLGASSIDLSWSDAQPLAEVGGYRVYWGTAPGRYDFRADVGLSNAHSLTGITPNVVYHAVVTALDSDGNESAASNEHADQLTAQVVSIRPLDQGQFCWVGRGPCPPRPGEIQRDAGRELLVPVDFPAGNWVEAELVVTLNSYATPGLCSWPNPTGDIFDRLFSVFLVEDETCIDDGGRCWGSLQLELMHAVTPFGTDTRVGPRVYTYDLTPFAPLLVGRKHVGVNINTWDGVGWWADVNLNFSELPADASPEPPADGFQLVHFSAGSAVTSPVSVTVPATATDVRMRLWVSGHGGATSPTCGNPADEFCPKDTRLLVDAGEVWRDSPWRTDCSARPVGQCGAGSCSDFNACGCPSCTFPRSAWCPGMITCHDDEPCDQDLDANAWLPPGGTYDLQYEIIDPTPGSWWAYSLVVYWYE